MGVYLSAAEAAFAAEEEAIAEYAVALCAASAADRADRDAAAARALPRRIRDLEMLTRVPSLPQGLEGLVFQTTTCESLRY